MSFLYGVSDKLHQSFVYGWSTSASGMLVNAIGPTAGVASLQFFVKAANRSTRLPFRQKPFKTPQYSDSE